MGRFFFFSLFFLCIFLTGHLISYTLSGLAEPIFAVRTSLILNYTDLTKRHTAQLLHICRVHISNLNLWFHHIPNEIY